MPTTAEVVCQTITVELSGESRGETYIWTLEEAIAIKDALIKAIGAQTAIKPKPLGQIPRERSQVRVCPSCGDQCLPGRCINVLA